MNVFCLGNRANVFLNWSLGAKLIGWICVLVMLKAPVNAGEVLTNLYREKLPVTFGMFVDLNFKVFSIQHSNHFQEVKLFIGKSGGAQLKIEFQRGRLPAEKWRAEKFIEDTSIKLRVAAESLVKDMWKLFPGEIPKNAFHDQTTWVSGFVFVNSNQVGWINGKELVWKRKPADLSVVTNDWRGKGKAKKSGRTEAYVPKSKKHMPRGI